MAKLVVSMNVSLDGFIEAGAEDDGSWLRIDEQVHTAFNELATNASAFVYGRKVYQVMIPYWPDAAADSTRPAHEQEYGRIWVEKPKVVFSSTLQAAEWSTRVVSTPAAAEVARLKQEHDGYLLCYGGPTLVSALAESGLVDEYSLFVHPTALGSGVPFFRSLRSLTLLDVKRFDQGALALRYAAGVL